MVTVGMPSHTAVTLVLSGQDPEDEEDTMKARKWALVGGLAVVLAVPTGMGVALAADSTPTPGAGPAAGRGTGGSGPPAWAPQECKDHYNSPEMQQWRVDHQAQRLAHRQEMLQRSGSS